MLLLALDTSTPAVTVALHDGARVVAESTAVDARRHTELLAPAIVEVLASAGVNRGEITQIAVGIGPGPFTGLRVGLATARTFGAVLDVPVHGVCSLDILAYTSAMAGAPGAGPFVVATDARRQEVYWALYDARGRRLSDPAVGSAAEISSALAACPEVRGVARGATGSITLPAAGSGARRYPDAFGAALDPEYPVAADLARSVMSDAVELVAPHPLYLRRPDAAPPSPRKRVLT